MNQEGDSYSRIKERLLTATCRPDRSPTPQLQSSVQNSSLSRQKHNASYPRCTVPTMPLPPSGVEDEFWHRGPDSCLPAASDKCLRYATSNKPCLSVRCSPFVGTLLGTTELTRRQPVGILKARTITLVRTVQAVPINDMSGLLTAQQSPVNVLLGRCCICVT